VPLFGKKKPKDEKSKKKEAKEYVICPHCYLDFAVEKVQQAGGICPSCKGKIDLEKQRRAQL
jgi:uncharacterized paraquat-inducible protein A